MNNQTTESANNTPKKHKVTHFYYAVKRIAYMKWHWFYWKILYLLKLARPYSILMCKLNLYKKFLDGRCHWCGNIH